MGSRAQLRMALLPVHIALLLLVASAYEAKPAEPENFPNTITVDGNKYHEVSDGYKSYGLGNWLGEPWKGFKLAKTGFLNMIFRLYKVPCPDDSTTTAKPPVTTTKPHVPTTMPPVTTVKPPPVTTSKPPVTTTTTEKPPVTTTTTTTENPPVTTTTTKHPPVTTTTSEEPITTTVYIPTTTEEPVTTTVYIPTTTTKTTTTTTTTTTTKSPTTTTTVVTLPTTTVRTNELGQPYDPYYGTWNVNV